MDRAGSSVRTVLRVLDPCVSGEASWAGETPRFFAAGFEALRRLRPWLPAEPLKRGSE